jgi:hypothetical protein
LKTWVLEIVPTPPPLLLLLLHRAAQVLLRIGERLPGIRVWLNLSRREDKQHRDRLVLRGAVWEEEEEEEGAIKET